MARLRCRGTRARRAGSVSAVVIARDRYGLNAICRKVQVLEMGGYEHLFMLCNARSLLTGFRRYDCAGFSESGMPPIRKGPTTRGPEPDR